MASEEIIARCVAAGVHTLVKPIVDPLHFNRHLSVNRLAEVNVMRMATRWLVEVHYFDRVETTGPFPDAECAEAFASEMVGVLRDALARVYGKFLTVRRN